MHALQQKIISVRQRRCCWGRDRHPADTRRRPEMLCTLSSPVERKTESCSP